MLSARWIGVGGGPVRFFRSLVQLCAALLAATLAAQARDLKEMSQTEIAALQQRLADGGCYQGAIDGQASSALQDAIKTCPSQEPVLRIETGMHVVKFGASALIEPAGSLPQDRMIRPCGSGHRRKGACCAPCAYQSAPATAAKSVPPRYRRMDAGSPPEDGMRNRILRVKTMSIFSMRDRCRCRPCWPNR